ncbi:MAG: hypothetical protein QOF76_1803 [Solirubrobacteraceae bacterium]|jgi:hypothetical protein|nr:hypothetical protein [Solirubrobacteraceae bacterium]
MPEHGTPADQHYGRIWETGKGGLALGDPGPDAVKALIGALTNKDETSADNDAITAGYTYLGQFIDHDLTFLKEATGPGADPSKLNNRRTPRFDLDSTYGIDGNHTKKPGRYDPQGRLLLGVKPGSPDPTHDLPPLPDLPRDGKLANIPDRRNDENQITAQIHILWAQFHNLLIDKFAESGLAGDALFDAAQREVIWHYQWIVYNDFLNRILGKALADEVRTTQKLKLPADKTIPVEFSAAAYRFGHSMVRTDYRMQSPNSTRFPVFDNKDTTHDLRGNRPISADRHIYWTTFFSPRSGDLTQKSMQIDHKISAELMDVPGKGALPELNIKRGLSLGLPSGGEVAKAMSEVALTQDELFADVVGFEKDAKGAYSPEADAIFAATPLWFYILREAAVLPGALAPGETRGERDEAQSTRLGRVGGRIVGETIVQLLRRDDDSFLNAATPWRPSLWVQTNGEWNMFIHQAYVFHKGNYDEFWDYEHKPPDPKEK